MTLRQRQPSLSAARTVPTPQVLARHVQLPARPSAVGRSREWASEQLRLWGFAEDFVDTVELVMSEFFTNAVIHTDSSFIACSLRKAGGRLRIEVVDEGTGHSECAARQPNDEDINGRGLMLVDAVTDQWGVSTPTQGNGRVVWAELSHPSA
ncbi:ATP-binding protein [Streptomyces sp. NPDC005438]|uniref:ATP-binding protein n=1 Tax=Streptomyces sp. NPDC005438 TaxID=3156880 RepID=UPI0033AC3351